MNPDPIGPLAEEAHNINGRLCTENAIKDTGSMTSAQISRHLIQQTLAETDGWMDALLRLSHGWVDLWMVGWVEGVREGGGKEGKKRGGREGGRGGGGGMDGWMGGWMDGWVVLYCIYTFI